MKHIYIAGPYRAATPSGVRLNIKAATAVAHRIRMLGHIPVSPHLMFAEFETLELSVDITTDADKVTKLSNDRFYLDATLSVMFRCDMVLLLPGWDESEGSIEERRQALAHDMSVFYDYRELKLYLGKEDGSRSDA